MASKKRKVNSLYLPNNVLCSTEEDFISQLSDDVLLLILSRVPTEEAIRTSVASKRWEHVWKKLPHLVLNTRRRTINPGMLSLSDDDSNPDAELTRVINNHYGRLESCEITHSANEESVHGLLETWIQMVDTRNLTLANRNILCSFPVDLFSHLKKVSSLCLRGYKLSSSIPFCSNIKTLKLVSIYATDVGGFHNMFASCPSLEVLSLNRIGCYGTQVGRRRSLEIKNSTLKFFELYSMYNIDEVIVSAPNLDILVFKDVFFSKYRRRNGKLLLRSPNLQQFNLNSSNACLHIVYNISKEKNNNWHEELVNRIGELLRRETYISLSVAVDLKNETQVERLNQVMSLLSSGNRLRDFSIKFKGINSSSSNPPSEEIDFFLEESKRYQRMWLYNFKGSKEEIAFVSCFIRQSKVEEIRIMINSMSFSNKSNVEAALAKLLDLQSELGHQKKVTIECFRDRMFKRTYLRPRNDK